MVVQTHRGIPPRYFIEILASIAFLGLCFKNWMEVPLSRDLLSMVNINLSKTSAMLLWATLFLLLARDRELVWESFRVCLLFIGSRLYMMLVARSELTLPFYLELSIASFILATGIVMTSFRYKEEKIAYRLVFTILSQTYIVFLINAGFVIGAIGGFKSSL